MISFRSRLYRFFLTRQLRSQPPITDVAALRTGLDALSRRFKMPKGVIVETLDVGGRPAQWLRPKDAAAEAAILYLHGGAYVAGSLNSHRSMAAHLAKASKVAVLLLDYRLAPEHAYPAALNDAQAAWEWLQHEAGLRHSRVLIAGDSAGGGLALACVHRLRDQAQPLPAGVLLLSPWTDLLMQGETMRTRLGQDPFFFSLDPLHACAALYAGKHSRAAVEISPVYGAYQGFPELFVQVGNDELLLSDAERVVAQAQAAGVKAQLEVWPGMWHVWQMAVNLVPESRRAIAQLGRAAQRMLA